MQAFTVREYLQRDAEGALGALAGIGLQRGTLFSILADAFDGHGDVRAGMRIVALDDDGRTLCDDTGARHGPYDLVVVADGAGSLLRSRLGRVRLDQPYPWGALWCLLPASGWPHLRQLDELIEQLRWIARPGTAVGSGLLRKVTERHLKRSRQLRDRLAERQNRQRPAVLELDRHR